MSVELFIEKNGLRRLVSTCTHGPFGKTANKFTTDSASKHRKKPNKKACITANTSSVKFRIASHISDERKEGTPRWISVSKVKA